MIRKSKLTLSVAFTCMICWLTIQPVESQSVSRSHQNITTGSILLVYLTIPTSYSQTVITVEKNAGFAGTVDPVAYLWNMDSNHFFEQNDDWGQINNPNAYTLCGQPSSVQSSCIIGNYPAGNYMLIVHAWSEAFTGNVDVRLDGNLVATNRAIGGQKLYVSASNDPSHPYTYEAVPAPLGPNETGTVDTVMLGLDSTGGLVAWNDDAVHLRSRFTANNVAKIVVGAYLNPYWGYETTKVHVYVNDATTDSDGDGVGDLLEQTLGTCHVASSPLCLNPKDSDNDGLTDAQEIFGYSESNHQYLPRWGANPRQKDLFVEVDYRSNLSSNPITHSQAMRLFEIFGEGQSDDINNPNGQNGIRIHLDLGINPISGQQHLHVPYGNFGGSNSFPTNITKAMIDDTGHVYNNHMITTRHNVFLHASLYAALDPANQSDLNQECGGIAGGAHWIRLDIRNDGVFTSGVPNQEDKEDVCTRSFAHELGHLLLIEHWGNSKMSSYPAPNNAPQITAHFGHGENPLHHSIMSYGFDKTAKNFYAGPPTATLNPTALLESQGIGFGLDPFKATSPMTSPPTSMYLAHNQEYNLVTLLFQGASAFTPVDWDRSLRIPGEDPAITQSSLSASDFSTQELRYSVSMSHESRATGAFTQNVTPLDLQPIDPKNPKMIRYNDANLHLLYVFHIKNGTIRYSSTPYQQVPNNTGSCQNSDVLNSLCSSWTPIKQVILSNENPISAKHLSAMFIFDRIYVAYTDSNDVLFLVESQSVLPNGDIIWGNPEHVQVGNVNVQSVQEPELAHVRIGNAIQLGLFYIEGTSGNQFHWHTRENHTAGLVYRGQVRDSNGQPLQGRISPSVVHWPDPFLSSVRGQTCAIFPEEQPSPSIDTLRMYCLNFSDTNPNPHWTRMVNAFQDLPSGNPNFKHNMYGKATLLFRMYRVSNGSLLDTANFTGQFWLIRNSNNWSRIINAFLIHPHEVHISRAIKVPPDNLLNVNLSYFLKDSFNVGSVFYGNTSISAYIDSKLSAIKAVGFRVTDDPNTYDKHLEFYPFFDGTFRAEFRAVSDFRIMEGGLCRSIRGVLNTVDCLSIAQTKWGL